MFYKISSDNRINNIHERTLGTMCQDHEASFTDLLPKNNSLITYRISSPKIVTEMLKVTAVAVSEVIRNIF